MKLINRLKIFISKFKFLLSFTLALIIALAPSFYEDYKRNENKKNIFFRYEVTQDIGLVTLRSRYIHIGSVSSLIDKYRHLVKREFDNKKFTVNVVMRKATAQTPMDVAVNLISKLHGPTIEMIKRPYIAKFSLYNNSNKSIVVKKLVIATDDAYPSPVWDMYYDYPCEKDCTIKHTIRNCLGYVLNFRKNMLLPANKKLQLFIFFSDLPIIKLDKSFAQIGENGDCDFTVPLVKEPVINFFNLYLKFTLKILAIFFIILGFIYTILVITTGIHSKNNKDTQQ